MPKKSKKKSKRSHPLAGYKGSARIGKGRGKGLSPAQVAALAKGQAKLAAMRAAGTIPGRGSAKKVVRAVKRAEKRAEKDVAKAAKRAARKASKSPSKRRVIKAAKKAVKHTPVMYGPNLPPGGVAGIKLMNQMAQHERETTAVRVAKALRKQYKGVIQKRVVAAAEQVVDKCAEDMKKIKQEAERTFAETRRKYQKKIREAKKAHAKAATKVAAAAAGKPAKGKRKKAKAHKVKAHKAKAHKAKAHKAKKPHKARKARAGKRRGHPLAGYAGSARIHPGGGKGRSFARPPMEIPTRSYPTGHAGGQVSAADVIKGARTRMKVKGRMMDFWACAGPVRSGCGSSGHVVRGVRIHDVPATRLRPGPKEVRI